MTAFYGIPPDGTVVLEVAAAAGLGLVAESERDVLRGNTAGVGEMIRHALDACRRSFVIGLGGSATNDAGVGMLAALGARFFDAEGGQLPATPEAMQRLNHLDVSSLHPGLKEATIRVACDVSNPLCGPNGATAIYGPQKGVTPELIPLLDQALATFASVLDRDLGQVAGDIPGAGAAGGLGFTFVGVLGAQLVRGIDLVLDITTFDARVATADLVLTGEGKTDGQTTQGKAVQGVASRASVCNVPVFCLSGAVTEDAAVLYEHGVPALMSITPGPVSLTESMQEAYGFLVRTVETAVRAWLAGKPKSCG